MTTPKANLAEPPTHSDTGKPHTLVIDDDITVADTVAMVLNTGGFEAIAVYSGEAGIELARHRAFEYLVTGVVMPQMNGIEAAIEIRKLYRLGEYFEFVSPRQSTFKQSAGLVVPGD